MTLTIDVIAGDTVEVDLDAPAPVSVNLVAGGPAGPPGPTGPAGGGLTAISTTDPLIVLGGTAAARTIALAAGVVQDLSTTPKDFNSTGITDGQALVYNATSNTFLPGSFAATSVSSAAVIASGVLASQLGGATASALTSEISRATAAEALLAPRASPTFGGTVTVPTPTVGDNTTKAASTAFVTTAINTETGARVAADALKAPLASPTFTGIVVVPTATTGDISTKAANTQFVANTVYTEALTRAGVDATLAPIASPTFTGSVNAPTPAYGDVSTLVATTAFCATLVYTEALTRAAATPIVASAMPGYIFENPATSTYPLRSTVTSSSANPIIWVGVDSPTIGGGYAVNDKDFWESTTV